MPSVEKKTARNEYRLKFFCRLRLSFCLCIQTKLQLARSTFLSPSIVSGLNQAMAALIEKPAVLPSLTLSLLPPSPLPSLLHARCPISPIPSLIFTRNSVGNQDWWRWSSPTVEEVRNKNHNTTGLNTFTMGMDSKRREGKLVGEWRVGEVLGRGNSGALGS